jgi:hypothetical protein
MERLDIYLYTYLEINKADFVGAKMYFFDYETTNFAYSYAEKNGCINFSPIIADANGRFPKIFIDKPYSVSIRNRSDVQIFHDDIE